MKNDPLSLPQDVLNILEMLGEDSYLVGGVVRNHLMDLDIGEDIDIATNTPIEDIKRTLRTANITFKEYPFHSVHFDYQGYDFEVTNLRIDGEYSNARHPDTIVRTHSIEEDSKRRDFTMNAIYFKDGVFYDFHEGLDDIQNQVIKVVGEVHRIAEDKIRILRLFRFAATFNFDIDKEIIGYLNQNQHVLNDISWSILYDEMYKFIRSPYRNNVIEKYPFYLGLLFEEIKRSINFNQHNPYHKYDLWNHTLHVIKHTPNTEIFFWTALFHDLGKLETQIIDEDGIGHYRGHSQASEKIARKYLSSMPMKHKTKEYICKLVLHHDIHLESEELFLQQRVHEYGYEFIMDILYFKIADNLSKSDKALYQVDKAKRSIEILKHLKDNNLFVNKKTLALNALEINEIIQNTSNINIVQDKLVYNVLYKNLLNTKKSLEDFLRSDLDELH